jgi:hypothetical protein
VKRGDPGQHGGHEAEKTLYRRLSADVFFDKFGGIFDDLPPGKASGSGFKSNVRRSFILWIMIDMVNLGRFWGADFVLHSHPLNLD